MAVALVNEAAASDGGTFTPDVGNYRILLWALAWFKSAAPASVLTAMEFPDGAAMTIAVQTGSTLYTSKNVGIGWIPEEDIPSVLSTADATWDNAPSAGGDAGRLVVFEGVDPNAPIYHTTSFSRNTGAAIAPSTPLNVVEDGAELWICAAGDGGSIVLPAGYTALFNSTTGTRQTCICYKLNTADGTAAPSFTVGSGRSAVAGVSLPPTPPLPAINSSTIADPLVEGTSEAYTGTDFEPEGTNLTINFGGAVQTVTASTNTTGTFTASIGTQLYGVDYELVAQNSLGFDSEPIIRLMTPPAGQTYWNVPGPLVSSGLRLTAIPDLAEGAQVHVISATGGAVADVEIFSDGSFATYDEAITAFLVRGNNNDASGWGASASQEVAEPVDTSPVFGGPDIADIAASLGDVLSTNYSGKFSDAGALTFSGVGTRPASVAVSSAGVEAGTLIEAGVFTGLRIRALNGDSLTADSNAYTITVSTVVPTLVGLMQGVATAAIDAAFLSVVVANFYSEVFAAGIVRDQSQPAGTVVGAGTAITISVSLGSRPVLGVSRTRPVTLRDFLIGD